jgi:hypothetical protein
VEPTVHTVFVMTRREGELYFDYIERVGLYTPANIVKCADVRDNSITGRLRHLLPEKALERLSKYNTAIQYLHDIQNYLQDIQKGIAPGTGFGDWMATCPPQFQDWDLLKLHSSSTVGAPAHYNPRNTITVRISPPFAGQGGMGQG